MTASPTRKSWFWLKPRVGARLPNHRELTYTAALAGALSALPTDAFAMHIAEGVITGVPVIAYTLTGLLLMAIGVRGIEKFQREHPDRKPLIGMGAAIIFFLSLIPIPAFTGTTSHPCGTPLVAILLGPRVALALAGISLMLQAAFFAHGGFATWGANLTALGLMGGLVGSTVFRLVRRSGLPIGVAGGAGGLLGDIAVYATSGLVLAGALVNAPHPRYDFWTYLGVIYGAYAPTQIPIAIGEMLITGLALSYAARQRPDVLQDLKIWGPRVAAN